MAIELVTAGREVAESVPATNFVFVSSITVGVSTALLVLWPGLTAQDHLASDSFCIPRYMFLFWDFGRLGWFLEDNEC